MGVAFGDVGSQRALVLINSIDSYGITIIPRQTRLDIPGALHYIIVRGINKSSLLADGQGKTAFLERVGEILDATEPDTWAQNTSSVNRALAKSEELKKAR
jgi:hypothetical protein